MDEQTPFQKLKSLFTVTKKIIHEKKQLKWSHMANQRKSFSKTIKTLFKYEKCKSSDYNKLINVFFSFIICKNYLR